MTKRYCHNCGTKLHSRNKYCIHCGAIQNNIKKGIKSYRIPTKYAILIILLTIAILVPIELFYIFNNADNINGVLRSKNYNVYIDALPTGVGITYNNALSEAFKYWQEREGVSFKQVSTEEEADIVIEWIKEFGREKRGHATSSRFVAIGLGDSLCIGKWKPYSYDTVKDISIHELGHILGYDDDYKDTNNIMYYQITTKYATDVEETNYLPIGLLQFYPICTNQEASRYSIEIKSEEPLDIYVVPSQEEYEKAVNSKIFDYYEKCQAKKITSFKKTCDLVAGSGVILTRSITSESLVIQAVSQSEYTIKIQEI